MAENAIENLVMDRKNKDLIKAIARIYTDGDQSTRFSADFIHGKGEGQIILLHGPPGTGKTLTAGMYQPNMSYDRDVLNIHRVRSRIYETSIAQHYRSRSRL